MKKLIARGRWLIAGVFIVVFSFSAVAREWYVDQAKGDDSYDGYTLSTAKKWLISTISGASEGDIIWVVGEFKITQPVQVGTAKIVIAGYGDDAVIDAQGKCRIMNLNAYSVVSNLTLKGGVDGSADGSSWSYPAAGVEMTGGTLTHCKVTGCRPKDADHHCSAVRITWGGVIQHCEIYDNDAGKLNTSYAAAVNLKAEGAKLLSSRIHNCRGRAVAVYVEAGLVEDCDIYCNTNYPASELSDDAAAGSGAGIRADTTGSRLSCCRIYDNYGYGNGGGMWLRDGAVAENCLLYGNRAATGGAVYCNSGNSTVRFCNFGGNTGSSGEGAAIYVNGGSPIFKNNIIYGNGAVASKEIKLESTSAPFTYNLLASEKSGTGNIVATKSPYVDAANGNYLTASDSEGIDVGANIDAVAKDILGTLRPQDGGTGKGAISDIGCVEFVDASVIRSPVVYVNPNGSDESPYDTPEKGAHSLAGALATVDALTLGHGEVRICGDAYDAQGADFPIAQPIWILGNGEGKPVISNASFLLNNRDAKISGVDLNGNCANQPYCVRVLQGTVTNCVVRGFRHEIARDEDFEGGAVVLAGTDSGKNCCRVVDSVISNNVVTLAANRPLQAWSYVTIGAGVSFRGGNGLLERCLVSGCTAAGNGGGVAAVADSGRIVDCEVAYCRACIEEGTEDSSKTVQGGGIFLAGNSTINVSGCNIHHNFADGSGGGVFASEGASKRIWNCRISDNAVYAFSGTGLRIEKTDSNVVVVNCLISGNRKNKNTGAASGVYLRGGRLVNCTISGNTGGVSAAGITVAAVEGGKYVSKVHNAIVWGNSPAEWDDTLPKEFSAAAGHEYKNIVVPAAEGVTGENIIMGNPKLSQSYMPRFGSSAIDAGDSELYSADNYGTLDLAGKPRFSKSGAIDCGCFEYNASAGLMLIFR